jgi:hypothetical protein
VVEEGQEGLDEWLEETGIERAEPFRLYVVKGATIGAHLRCEKSIGEAIRKVQGRTAAGSRGTGVDGRSGAKSLAVCRR